MKTTFVLVLATLIVVLGAPFSASAATNTTVGAGGIYPSGTSFNGIPINGVQSGYGVKIGDNGSASGQFCTILLGVSVLGLEQDIRIEGKASSGSQNAMNIVTFSGTCTVDMGNGTPPTPGVPFTATVITDANDQGTIGLVIGATRLPDSVVNSGSMTIK
jgi:hypothetical protein